MNNSSEAANGTQDFPQECTYGGQSPALEWIKTIVYLIILFLALFGNAMVIWIIYRHRRMQTATNYLIVNMAVGDLFMAIFSMIPNAVSMLRGSHSWVTGDALFGQISCKLWFFLQGCSMACSILTLTALAFERFFAVVFPMWKAVTVRRTKWLIPLIWLASCSYPAPLLYAAKVKLYDGVPYCVEDWAPAFDPIRSLAIFTIITFVFLYALPLLVISVLYSVIIARVWGRDIPGNATPANQRLLNKSKKNVLKMLITVVVGFALCWFPMQLNMLLMDFSDVFVPCGIPIGLQTTAFLFGHANSAINCCIYVIFSQDFRRGFKEILKPLFRTRSGTLLFRSSKARATMEATVDLQTSYKGQPQARGFKVIDTSSC